MNSRPVKTRRPSGRRVAAGLLAGLSWIVTLEFLFGYAFAMNGRAAAAVPLLLCAVTAAAFTMLLLFADCLRPRDRVAHTRKPPATPTAIGNVAASACGSHAPFS